MAAIFKNGGSRKAKLQISSKLYSRFLFSKAHFKAYYIYYTIYESHFLIKLHNFNDIARNMQIRVQRATLNYKNIEETFHWRYKSERLCTCTVSYSEQTWTECHLEFPTGSVWRPSLKMADLGKRNCKYLAIYTADFCVLKFI